jgi:YVTN family beta-propeller protein
MEFRLLGSLEVLVDGREVGLGGARQRAVLAILLLHRREVVSVDRLVDEIWGATPPQTATKTVQVYVSRLRKVLGDGVLVTRGGGYALLADPEDVDVDVFERLAVEGREALDRGDAGPAAERFGSALELWRGEPLAEFAYEEFARNEIARLEELHLAVLEDRIEAELALGRHAALVAELESLVAEHPTRERLRGQLMLALYRSGRQTDALESYRDARRALERELGLEPGPELQRLERAILTQDPAIAAPSRRGAAVPLQARRSPALLLFGGGLLLAVAAAVAIAISGGDSNGGAAAANSLAVIDPSSNRLLETVATGIAPTDVSPGLGSIWVANTRDDSATQVDPEDRTVVSTVSPSTNVAGLAAGAGGVWMAASRGEKVVRFDPAVRASRSIRLASAPDVFPIYAFSPVAVGYGSAWVVRAGRSIARVDAERNQVVARIAVGNSTSAIATGSGGVWLTDDVDNTVAKIDPRASVVVATTPVGQGPVAVATGEGAIWVANAQDGTVARVDPSTTAVTETITVGGRPAGIAAGEGAVWVANSVSGTVSRIDPETNRVEATVEVGQAPQSIAVANGLVWVSVQAEPAPPASPSDEPGGDTVHVVFPTDPGPTDPALGNFAVTFPTCAKLYNYPDRPFPDGADLQPEVATGPPRVTGDGLTYTFHLRSGYRFSPPSNEPVTAAAFERAIERVLSPKMNSYGRLLLRDVGAVNAHGQTLVISLTKPVPNLAERLGADYFCAVPPEAPSDPAGIDELPSAGPYYVASRDAEKSLVLRQNPNYEGPRPHEPAEIRFTFGITAEDGVAEVEAGRADYVDLHPELARGVTPNTERRLQGLYGPQSEAARAGRQQLFAQPLPTVFSFAFNTRRGPFVDARMRRAVNYAIDREELARDPGFGAPGRPADQYIPPGLPGFHDATIYPLGGPDVAMARRLSGGQEHRAILYTCDTPGCTRNAEILRTNLRAIGITLDVRQFPIDTMFRREFRPGEPWDIGMWGWAVDYADPFDYINNQFATGAQHPGGFYDPGFERRMEAASRLSGAARQRAYARLDRELAEQAAPQATFANAELRYLLSARIGCQVPHPIYGLDFAALCFRDG